MRARLLIIAIGGLSIAAAASAEPPKAPVQKADQPTGQSRPLIVASADETPAQPAAEQQNSAPAKPARHARVTTCRCGDPTPGN